MKAYILNNIGDFYKAEIEKPIIGNDEVLVQVKAAGICGSDIPRIYETGAYSYPLIPGHEFSGVVVEVGKEVEEKWLGKRVSVFPLIPCKQCLPCQNKQYELCRHYGYIGSRRNGGFAEYVAVPVWNLVPIPYHVSFIQAAMLEPLAVAEHAICRANIDQEDVVAICGLGTIGLLITMLLIAKGITKLFVIGNKNLQQELALKMGIPQTHCCNSKQINSNQWLDEITQQQGIDVFFDCVGKNEVIETALNYTNVNGKIVLVGNPLTNMNLLKESYWKILRNQLTIIGTWNSSFNSKQADNWRSVLHALEIGRITPEKLITHKFSFDNLKVGFEMMRDKKEEYVKVLGVFDAF